MHRVNQNEAGFASGRCDGTSVREEKMKCAPVRTTATESAPSNLLRNRFAGRYQRPGQRAVPPR